MGIALFAASAAAVSQGLVAGEKSLFVAVNSLPDVLYYLIWPFMQYGVFLTIPVLAVIALMLRRVRLAAAMAIDGVGVYLLARIVKELVKRGRPEALIGNIEARETFAAGSLGFPSGHVAVAAALTVVVTPTCAGVGGLCPRSWRSSWHRPNVVGAHTPLDLVGGATLGVAAGCAANLVIGVPPLLESSPRGQGAVASLSRL